VEAKAEALRAEAVAPKIQALPHHWFSPMMDVKKSRMGMTHVAATMTCTFVSVRQFRYFAGMWMEQNRSIVMNSTV
jgi:hypothetical protein